MLQGKLKAPICWAIERSKGTVLSPEDHVENSAATVLDVLHQRHPAPSPPTLSSLLRCDNLPLLEDVELTGSHILYLARTIQGGAGPGRCDAYHWRDALLRYGAHSARLRDTVAALARWLTDSIVPWDDIRALACNRLIALDKCPVRPISIGEMLRFVIGHSICSATRADICVVLISSVGVLIVALKVPFMP